LTFVGGGLMNYFDWLVIIVYGVGMIGMSVYLGRNQESEEDYYLGSNDLGFLSIGISTMATQCSTNSLLGAPAFVIAVGGLLWLQYEIAVPLAVIAVMIFLLPFFRKQNIISVYEYLEKRFGVGTRTFLSVTFQFLRAFSTGVTVFGISLVLQKTIGISFGVAVILLGIVTVVYDFFGGMKAVVYSDVIQMIVLYCGILIATVYAIYLTGGISEVFSLIPEDKSLILDFSHHGFGDGKTFAFWPMLIGGFFLYVSYYGCDQTQVQRELSSKDLDDTNMSLFVNGIFRFPLVLTYIFLGTALVAYIAKHPEFLNLLKTSDGNIEYNLAVPTFVLQYLPHGIIGLIFVALFSAAMSSLDSTINSLSALTMRDVIERFFIKSQISKKTELFLSRITTIFWGILCIIFAFFVGGISESIVESINKIGSLLNGSILATFLLAILTKRANGYGAVSGIIVGFLVNIFLWIYYPEISWMWWNAIGCLVTFSIGYTVSIVVKAEQNYSLIKNLIFNKNQREFFQYKRNWPVYYSILTVYFFLIILICYFIQKIPSILS
jgi:SSS family solute:Na+ symporter